MKQIAWALATLVMIAGCGEPAAPVPDAAPDGNAPAAQTDTAPMPAADTQKVEQAAADFYAAFAKGDVDGMMRLYADNVTLLARSEFLKPEWSINPDPNGNRETAITVTRGKLQATYETFFDKVGEEKWQAIFGKLPVSGLRYCSPADCKPQFDAAKADDVVVLVPFGHGDDVGAFVFRKDVQGAWKIVMELTDY